MRSLSFSSPNTTPTSGTPRKSKVEDDNSSSISTITPAKHCNGEGSSSKSGRKPVGDDKLPQKYEMLCELFDSLDSSIRLLRLKGSMPTLSNISPKIQCLTDRRFTYRHLAQLKYVLPEAIHIKRVLMFDDTTSCMKPDLRVSLNVDAIQSTHTMSKPDSINMCLRKAFRSRLVDFHNSHPQGDEIPGEILPEPFNRSVSHVVSDSNKALTTSSCSEGADLPPSEVASHFSRSFQKRFSQKSVTLKAEDDTNSLQDSPQVHYQEESAFPVQNPVLNQVKDNSITGEPGCVSLSCLLATPTKETGSCDSFLSTPAKLVSTPARLMTSTPALQPPKRSYMSPDDNPIRSPDKLARRPPRTRSLKFDTPVKTSADKTKETRMSSGEEDDNILNILPGSLIQSIREKEKKANRECDPAISQAKRRRQMIACLPKLFNMVHFLFQSIKRSVITKEEFMHKIISSHTDIIDRREVEEQFNLLLELVPEWISEKTASSGDLLVCINKMCNAEGLRARIEEAK